MDEAVMRNLKSLKIVGLSLGLFILVSCGSQSRTTTINEPNLNTTPGSSNLPTGPGSQTPGIPDLSKAVALALVDNTTYAGLIDLAGMVFPPLVGDALVQLRISNDRNGSSFTAEATIAFEDAQGFWGAKQSSFAGTTYRTSNYIDFTTSEGCPAANTYYVNGTPYCNVSYPLFSLRIAGSIVNNQLYGAVYYRVRQNGETQCWPLNNPFADTATPCINYMNVNNSQVKKLGTFNNTYSNWIY